MTMRVMGSDCIILTELSENPRRQIQVFHDCFVVARKRLMKPAASAGIILFLQFNGLVSPQTLDFCSIAIRENYM